MHFIEKKQQGRRQTNKISSDTFATRWRLVSFEYFDSFLTLDKDAFIKMKLNVSKMVCITPPVKQNLCKKPAALVYHL